MTVRGSGTFAKRINDFAKETPQLTVQVTNKAILDLFTKVVLDTPVDTGRARGNWQVSIGHSLESSLITKDKDGNETIRSAQAKLLNDKTSFAVFIQNNLSYIKRLEYGWSRKSPRGMLRKNIALMNSFLKNALSELKGGK
jgi:hypothetical protein